MIKLRVMKIGLALGITWAIGAFLLGLMSFIFDWGSPMVNLIASVYIGYESSFLGSVIGALWAFIDAFILGVVFAWIYNRLL